MRVVPEKLEIFEIHDVEMQKSSRLIWKNFRIFGPSHNLETYSDLDTEISDKNGRKKICESSRENFCNFVSKSKLCVKAAF